MIQTHHHALHRERTLRVCKLQRYIRTQHNGPSLTTNELQCCSIECVAPGPSIPPNGNDANSPSPHSFLLPFPSPLPLRGPFPLPSFPFPPLPSPGVWGQTLPPVAGVDLGVTPEKKLKLKRIWCILAHFCNLKTTAKQTYRSGQKRRTYKLRMTHISGEFFPLQCVILFPLTQFGRKLRPLPPPVDAPA